MPPGQLVSRIVCLLRIMREWSNQSVASGCVNVGYQDNQDISRCGITIDVSNEIQFEQQVATAIKQTIMAASV